MIRWLREKNQLMYYFTGQSFTINKRSAGGILYTVLPWKYAKGITLKTVRGVVIHEAFAAQTPANLLQGY